MTPVATLIVLCLLMAVSYVALLLHFSFLSFSTLTLQLLPGRIDAAGHSLGCQQN